MDVFYEESSLVHNAKKDVRKYTIVSVISYVFLVLGILGIILMLNFPLEMILPLGVLTASMFVSWFLFSRFKRNFNVSYDYSFVSGELRIAKVFNTNKRKLVARFDSKDIIQFGDVDNPSFERFRNDPTVKMILCTSNDTPAEGKFFMYILAEYNGKKLFVLECRETMLMHILRFATRTKLESDYVMQEKKQK